MRLFATTLLVIVAIACNKSPSSKPVAQTCALGYRHCGATCTDKSIDVDNCGQCGHACASGETCSSGSCVPTSECANTLCGSICVNTNTSTSYCGNCATACNIAQQQTCSGGVCVCPVGHVMNAGSCVSTCMATCVAGASCLSGTCTCPTSNPAVCGDACVNTQTNVDHCGTCGKVCPADQVCTDGHCGFSCTAPETVCPTGCADLQTDPENCGTCGTQCRAGQSCASGHCTSPTPQAMDFCNAGERPMVVKNQSSEEIWLGMTAGSISCSSNAECANFGGTCTRPAPGTCKCPSTTPNCSSLGESCLSNSDCTFLGSTCFPEAPPPQRGTKPTDGICTCTTASPNCGSLASCAITTTVALPGGQTGHLCFWNPPRLVNSSTFKMPQGASLQFCFPSLQSTGGNFQWSGNLFARRGCDSNGQNCVSGNCTLNILPSTTPGPSCPHPQCQKDCDPQTPGSCASGCSATNYCGPSYVPTVAGHAYEQDCPYDGTCAPKDGSCILGQGGSPPNTLAEFTLTGTDYYDISIINGINMGISMAPDRTNAQLSATDPYVCGTPGAKTQAVTTPQYLKACPWTIDLNVPGMGDQTNLLRQVKPNVEAGVTIYPTCPCTAPYVCGLALNVLNTKQGKFVQTCGTDVKTYWTADQICGTLPPGGGPVNNLYPLPCVTNGSSSENATLTYMTSLLECTGEKGFSCYQGSTAPQCRTGAGCGCPTLEANNLWPLPGPTVTNNCTGTNADWTQYIQPWLVGLKAACPTAYTFPYDDVTSTFTCRAAAGFAGGAPGYTVTLFDTK